MTLLEDKLRNLHTVHLPEEVKIRMRAELMAYAELHSTPLASPAEFMPAPVVLSPFYKTFSMRLYAGFAAVLLIVMSAGGTAYASENSLPGDVLYSVKVGIAEPIQTALVPSERGKAAWNAILAERRLEEAAQLAAQNRLTPAAQTELAANFTAHVAASETHAASLQKSGDTSGSLSVQSDLEARLTAHEQILDVIAAHYAAASSSDSTETKTSLATLLTTVRDHQDAISTSRLALENAMAPRVDADGHTVSATTTTEIAIAHVVHFRHGVSPAARVAGENAARSEEITSILDHHATLLAKFLPVATTTASTTLEMGTTTATTTSREEMKNIYQSNKENPKQ
jgi:hypothetical protein